MAPRMNEAFSDSLGQQVPRMYRVALRILGDANRAEEVVQEACLRALRGIGRFQGRAALATWLHRITVNCAIDHLHDQQKRKALRASVDGVLAALETTPAETAERRELYRIVEMMVRALPDDCRTAFVLTQLDGYTYDEAAEIEGKPRGTIASRVFRAKKILLEQMNAHMDGRAKP